MPRGAGFYGRSTTAEEYEELLKIEQRLVQDLDAERISWRRLALAHRRKIDHIMEQLKEVRARMARKPGPGSAVGDVMYEAPSAEALAAKRGMSYTERHVKPGFIQ